MAAATGYRQAELPVLPADPDLFISDRTTREVVVLNLFVALLDLLVFCDELARRAS